MKARAFISILIVLISCFFFFQNQCYWYKSQHLLSSTVEQELTRLTQIAVQHQEVPVASLVIYQDRIIGKGYNTVTQNQDIGGHAEINAISNAIYQMGYPQFMQLDRSQLYLLSTYEPCLMCRGAMINYNIQHTVFIQHKNWWHWTKQNIKTLRYEWKKEKARSVTDTLQKLLLPLQD